MGCVLLAASSEPVWALPRAGALGATTGDAPARGARPGSAQFITAHTALDPSLNPRPKQTTRLLGGMGFAEENAAPVGHSLLIIIAEQKAHS